MEKHDHHCMKCHRVWTCDRPEMCIGEKCPKRNKCEKRTCNMAQSICASSRKSICDSCMEKIIWG
jgi:hypothetical protein